MVGKKDFNPASYWVLEIFRGELLYFGKVIDVSTGLMEICCCEKVPFFSVWNGEFQSSYVWYFGGSVDQWVSSCSTTLHFWKSFQADKEIQHVETINGCCWLQSICKFKLIIQTCRFFQVYCYSLYFTIFAVCWITLIHSPSIPAETSANGTRVATGERLYFGNLAVGETMFWGEERWSVCQWEMIQPITTWDTTSCLQIFHRFSRFYGMYV